METSVQKIAAIIPASEWAASDAMEFVRLDHDERTRRRAVFRTSSGEDIMLQMPYVVRLRDNDGLKLEGGRTIRVEAKPEPLVEISAPDLRAFVRIAWHLGNRHLPTQIHEGALRIRADHVIVAMVEFLGGACKSISAPFDPEGGAYETGAAPEGHTHHGHAHDHNHHHD